jgi:hypothetical protein
MVTNPKIVHCTNDFKGAMRALVQAAMRYGHTVRQSGARIRA